MIVCNKYHVIINGQIMFKISKYILIKINKQNINIKYSLQLKIQELKYTTRTSNINISNQT